MSIFPALPRRVTALLFLASLALPTLVAGDAAATWANERRIPRLGELVVIDRTGEPGWLFGAEDVGGDGLATFEQAERAIDLRTAYARTAAGRLWLRAYVASEELPDETLRVFFFLDTDRNADTGGSSVAPEIDVGFGAAGSADAGVDAGAEDAGASVATTRGYEYVVGVQGDTALSAVWRYDAATRTYQSLELPPLNAIGESGTDRDPLLRSETVWGYAQIALDFQPLELTASCDARLLVRSLTPDGIGDRDMGLAAPCVPGDSNGNGVPDQVEVEPSGGCTSDAACPAQAVCVDRRCIHPGYCDLDGDCGAGELCSDDGVCRAVATGSCSDAIACSGGLVCSSAGQCSPCGNDASCPDGLRCAASGRCVDGNSPSGSSSAGGSSSEGGVTLAAGEEVQGGACACRVVGHNQRSGKGPWLGALGLVAVWLLRRRRTSSARMGRLGATLFALSCVLLSTSARAQVDAERFDPAVTHDGWLSAEGSAVRHPDDRWELGAWLSYAHRPLIVATADDALARPIVEGRVGMTLLASVSLTESFAVGVGLPAFFQSGEGLSGVGLGDLRLVPKLELLSDVEDGFGVSLAGELRAPTHSGDFSGGADMLEALPKIILDHRFRGGLRFGVNAGVALRERATFLNVIQGNELIYAAALGYRFGGLGGATELGAELDGALLLQDASDEEVALEGRAFLRHDFSDEWTMTGGAGAGMLAGYGVPTARIFFGVTYAPTSHDRDRDGVTDSKDECPEYREDRDAYQDGDGCPEEDPDDDGDGVSNFDDQCPGEKETINGVDDEDGCPDEGPAHVRFTRGRFVIDETIRFQTGSNDIQPNPHPLLDELALSMRAHHEVKQIRIAGHTDDTGPRDVNMRLSEQRARAVKRYLVEHGVSARRLRVESYGPDRPLQEGKDRASRAKNRRVEFIAE